MERGAGGGDRGGLEVCLQNEKVMYEREEAEHEGFTSHSAPNDFLLLGFSLHVCLRRGGCFYSCLLSFSVN